MSDPKIDKAKGQIKEVVGKITGDKRLETEGQVEQAGAKSAARSLWQALARERQHDPVLRSRSNDGESGLPLP